MLLSLLATLASALNNKASIAIDMPTVGRTFNVAGDQGGFNEQLVR